MKMNSPTAIAESLASEAERLQSSAASAVEGSLRCEHQKCQENCGISLTFRVPLYGNRRIHQNRLCTFTMGVFMYVNVICNL
jgi:hypothetical protein